MTDNIRAAALCSGAIRNEQGFIVQCREILNDDGSCPNDRAHFGYSFAEFKKSTRVPSDAIKASFCSAKVERVAGVEICGHPLDDDGNCANASAHLS